jgi:uncharacterized protein YbjQ (UPF0145 family)
MITTAECIYGFKITQVLGPIEGIFEKSFTKMSLAGIGVIEGGELRNMLFDAKQELARNTYAIGANAVIGFRYALGMHSSAETWRKASLHMERLSSVKRLASESERVECVT